MRTVRVVGPQGWYRKYVGESCDVLIPVLTFRDHVTPRHDQQLLAACDVTPSNTPTPTIVVETTDVEGAFTVVWHDANPSPERLEEREHRDTWPNLHGDAGVLVVALFN